MTFARTGWTAFPNNMARVTLDPMQPAFERWIALDQMPAPVVTLEPIKASFCDGAESCRTTDGTNFYIYAANRSAFYFELGGIMSALLTPGERTFLARKWQDPHWRWFDSAYSVAHGYEDGLEALFAVYYQACAWGQDTRDESINVEFENTNASLPGGNSGSFDTCAYLRSGRLKLALGPSGGTSNY